MFVYAVRSLRVPPPLLWELELLRGSCGCGGWLFVMAGCGLGKSKNKKIKNAKYILLDSGIRILTTIF